MRPWAPLVTFFLWAGTAFLALAGPGQAVLGQSAAGAVSDEAQGSMRASDGASAATNGPLGPYVQPVIPPEVLEQIEQAQRRWAGQMGPIMPPLTGVQRLVLVVVAVVLVAGGVLGRWVVFRTFFFCSPGLGAMFLGVFVAVAALLLGSVVLGCLYMHVAAAACLVISGFTLTSLLAAHIAGARQPLSEDDTQSSNGPVQAGTTSARRE